MGNDVAVGAADAIASFADEHDVLFLAVEYKEK